MLTLIERCQRLTLIERYQRLTLIERLQWLTLIERLQKADLNTEVPVLLSYSHGTILQDSETKFL